MTVLACLHDLGLAFSDVMLSLDAPGGHLLLPTTGSTMNVPQGLTISPSKLVRKFFRITERGRMGMFLVAGTVSHIRRLIFNIQLVRTNGGALNDRYRRLLNNCDPVNIIHIACLKTEDEGHREFEILGVIEGQVFVRNFDENRVTGKLPYYGDLYIAGGGGLDLFRWLAERAAQYIERPLINDSIVLKTVRSMHSVPMMLLEEDSSNRAKTIVNGVGGYYEAYIIGNKGLEPVDAVLSVIATVRGKGEKSFLQLDRLYFHKYVGDWLIVVSIFGLPIEVYLEKPTRIPLEQMHIFKIPPIFDEGPKPNWTVDRMASAIESAKHFRLTLRREVEPSPIHIRFSEGEKPCRRLFSSKVIGQNFTLSLRQAEFEHYLSRFPVSLPPDNQPINLYS